MEYRVLGPLEVLDEGRPLTLRGEKQRALLAILLTPAGHFPTIDWLIDALWDGAPPETAASALRVHITGLRAVLEPNRPRSAPSVRLPLVGQGYRLTMEPDELDAQRFERAIVLGRSALDRGHAEESARLFGDALALWRGPPLSDVGDLSCLRSEAYRLEELRVGALEGWFDARLILGQHASVVDELSTAVAAQPLRERLTGQLALALYRCRRQADALREVGTLRSRLLDELGIDLSPELRTLEYEILEQSPQLEWSEPARSEPLRPARESEHPSGESFVGRKRELDVVRALVEGAFAQSKRAVFIGGAAGIGKTALCAHFAGESRAAGVTVCYGRCDATPVGPYQPFTECLRALLRQHPLPTPLDSLSAELARLVPELEPDASSLRRADANAETDRHRLFEAVAAMLRGIGQPVVLVIDDVQWADTPSILLMRHLARHDDAGEVFFVVTYRDAAPAPAAFITETMARLVRDGIAERIVLEGLGESDVEALIRATTRAEILPDALDLSRHLCELTGGNPFFLTEILRDLDDRGTQIDPRQLREATPVGVRDVVAERLARLSETTTLLLHIAAVVGQEFELSLIAEVSGLDEGIVLDAVETALGARLVHESSTIDRFVFTHAIVRNVIYRELPASRRVRLHRRVGEAIELDVADQTASRATELAHHFLEAAPVGGAEKGAGYAVVAAREAEARLAFEAALELCDRALEALRTQHAVPDVECDLLIQKGRAELSCGRDGARTTLFDAFEMADQINDPDRMAAALLSFTRGFFSRMGRTDTEYVQSIERAISARPPGDDTTTAELLGTLASELVWSPDGERRFALSDEALAMSRRLEDGWALARVLLLRNMTISAPDTLEERTQECAELSRLAEQLQDPGIRFQAAFHRSGTAHEAGDIGTADQLCDIASEIALERREPTLQWMADFMQTSRSLAHGELVEAERLAQQGHAIGRRANRAADAQMFFGEQILEIRRWQDRLVEMLPFFGDLAGDDRFDFGYTLLRYLFDAGETTKATRIYGDVMSRVALPPRRDMLAMPTLCSLSYLAARVGDTEHAPELYAELLPWAHTVGKTIVARPVGHHCLGMLAASMHDGDTAEHHLTAAIAAHDAMRMPLLAAESRLERAKVIVERGGPEADGVAAEIESVRVTAEASGAAMLGRCCDELRLGSR